jgi:hypothetical protein
MIFIVAIVSFSGCTEKEDGTTVEGEAIIGTLLPITGDLAQFGGPMENAAKLAIDEVNANGGLLGSEVSLINEDSQTSEIAGVDGANKLVKVNKVPALIGAAGSGVSLAIIDITTGNNVVQISPSNTGTDFTTYADNDFYFRTCPSDALQGTPETFNITINQSVDVTWYINGMKVHNDTGVKASDYTNLSAVLGVWNVLATATNDNGTCMHIWIWNVTETWVVSMNLTLRPGWNHISIPVELLNDSVNSVFSGVQMRGMNVYRYRAIGFEAVTTVEPKVGYRVYSRRPITITITGNSIKNTLDLRAGWNLIGLPVNPIDPSVDSVFSDIQMCGENVYKYGSSGFESVNSVESKTGYWVYSRRPITITIEGIPVTS